MPDLAIVAIPAENEYVHRISSEQVAHCTLLFLGDAVNPNILRIAEFLQHAVNIMEIGPFGLEVDYRGKLGDDQADVLFFRKGWSCKRIELFRNQLLKNTHIRDAYDSVEQHPEWKPHLTMGYPDSPAREDPRDFPGFYWIEFDRIALWYGNYEGPEFRLEYNYNNDLAEVAMSLPADRGRDFLEHYGIKGMRWGKSSTGSPAAREVSAQSVVNQGLKSKTKIKAKGGENHPAAEDAIKAAVSKQKLKKSGAKALSNHELQELANRMNLEQQVKRLAVNESRNPAKKFVADTILGVGKQQVTRIASDEATKRVDRALSKR